MGGPTGEGPHWVLVDLTTRPHIFEGTAREVPNGGLVDSVIERRVSERNYDFIRDGRRVGLLRESPPARQGGSIHVVLNWAEEVKQRVPAR